MPKKVNIFNIVNNEHFHQLYQISHNFLKILIDMNIKIKIQFYYDKKLIYQNLKYKNYKKIKPIIK